MRTVVMLGAAAFVFGGTVVGCNTGPDATHERVGAAGQALTAAQCNYFSVDDSVPMVQLCHKTGSTTHPYTILRISEQACITAHAAHPGDYATSTDPSSPLYDPSCNGQGCLPEGAPVDSTIECCEGLVAREGTCVRACAPGRFLYETRPYTAGGAPQSSAEAVGTFNALSTGVTGYGSAVLASLAGMSNQRLIGGSDRSIGYHIEATFEVAPADAGTWQFRFGADFGLGGTLLVDGNSIDFRATDMWWDSSFSDPTQYLQGSAPLAAGLHTVSAYGFENCCDGPTQMEYWSPTSGGWRIVSATTLDTCYANNCPLIDPCENGSTCVTTSPTDWACEPPTT